MYLSKLRIWNFRKYGQGSNGDPGLEVVFNKTLNLLVGENDSGKTAIIDAIKYVLHTQSNDYFRIDIKDFHKKDSERAVEFNIECIFKDFTNKEAANFIEWLTFDEKGDYELQVRLTAKRARDNRIIYDIKAGPEGADVSMDGNARELLKVTYLKPLRDAENELTPGYRSRLAQILRSHELFQKEKNEDGTDEKHILEKYIGCFNEKINEYFTASVIEKDSTFGIQDKIIKTGKDIKDALDTCLKELFHKSSTYRSNICIAKSAELEDILRKLSLDIDDNLSGLGSLNLLFIGAELLLLQQAFGGLRLALIEEIEAHLHPQAQLRVINYLKSRHQGVQSILTTHSITLASSIELKSLIICKDDKVFPMGSEYTKLDEADYEFLERFLDATKANLFFARGVIVVEGDAENILLPAIAQIIDRPLASYGISIVNVGSTAYKRYANIFLRKNGSSMNMPVAVITDMDVKPVEYYYCNGEEKSIYEIKTDDIEKLRDACPNVSWDRMVEEVYDTEGAVEAAMSENKITKTSRNNGKSNALTIIKQCKRDITKEDIPKIKKKKKDNYKSMFGELVEVFLSPNWTLEYEIALSDLREYLQKAVLVAVNDKQGEYNKEDIKDEKAEQDKELSGKTPEEIAYTIYKPLFKGQASKAVAAQYLVKYLLEEQDQDKIKNILTSDTNLQYLVKAIYHVTEGSGNE